MNESVRVLLEIQGDASEGLAALRSIQSEVGKFGSVLSGKMRGGVDQGVSALGRLQASARTTSSVISSVFGRIQQASSSLGNSLTSSFRNFSFGELGEEVFGSLIADGISRVTGAVNGMIGGMISGNAQFETFTTQFTSLLGGADEARAHLDNLATFAATTPFELPGVITASKNLLTFGGDALNTMDNLTLFGNAAAVSGQSFEEVSFWVGRAYNAIQNGQPFGEASARLQEMGILGGDARLALEQLQEEGAKGPEVWAAFTEGLNAPEGAMDDLSRTFSGMMSTLSDTLAGISRDIGAPIFDALKNAFGPALAYMSDPGGEFQSGVTRFADLVGVAVERVVAFLTTTFVPNALTALSIIRASLGYFGSDSLGAFITLSDALNTVFSSGTSATIITFFSNIRVYAGLARDAITTFGQSFAGDWTNAPTKILPIHQAFGRLGIAAGIARDAFLTFVQALAGNWADSTKIAPLHSAIGNFGILVRTDVLPAVKELFGFLQQNAGGIAGTAVGFLALNKVLQGLTLAIGAISIGWTIFTTAGALVSGVMASIGAASLAASTATGALGTVTAVAGSSLLATFGAIALAVAALGLVAYGLYLAWTTNFGGIQEIVAAAGAGITSAFTTILANVQPVLTLIGAYIQTEFLPAITGLGTVFLEAGAAIQPVIEQINATWQTMAPNVISSATAIGTVLAALATIIGGTLIAAWTILSNVVAAVFPAAVGLAVGVINVIIGNVQIFVGIITGAVAVVSAILQGDWAGAWTAAGQLVANVGQGIITVLTGLIVSVIAIVTGLVNGVIALFTSLYVAVVGGSIIPDMVTGVIEWISRLPAAVLQHLSSLVTNGVAKFNELKNALVGMAGEFLSAMHSIGTSIVQGVANGISAGVGLVTSAVRRLADLIPGPIKEMLGIGSPSKVMAEEVGEPVSQGVAVGIEDASGQAKEAIAETMDDVKGEGKKKGKEAGQAAGKSVEDALADSIQKMAGAVKAGVEALGLLSEYDAGNLQEASIAGFTSDVERVVEALTATARRFTARGLEQAERFADAATKVLGLVKNGMEALIALREYDEGSLFEDAIYGFVGDVERVVASLVEAARRFSTRGLEAASAFADTATKVLGLITNGITALIALMDYDEGAISGLVLQSFVNSVYLVVVQIQEASEGISEKGLAAAERFADGAGKVLALVGTGIEAIVALTGFDEERLSGIDVQDFLNSVYLLVIQIQEASEGISEEGLLAAERFAEGAGNVLALVGAGIEAIVALANLDEEELTGFIIQDFLSTVYLLVVQIQEASEGISERGLAAAERFAEGAGKVVALVSSAVEALSLLARFSGVPVGSINLLGAGIKAVVALMIRIASELDAEGVESAALFADAAARIIAPIKAAVDTFDSLRKYKDVPEQRMIALAADMHAAIYWMISISRGLEEQGVEAAALFASMAAQIFGGLKGALDLFDSLRNYENIPQAAIQSFTNDFYGVIGLMQGLLVTAQEGLVIAQQFQDAALGIAAAISTSATAFDAVGGEGEEEEGGMGAGLMAQVEAGAEQIAEIGTQIGLHLTEGIGLGLTEHVDLAVDNLVLFFELLEEEAFDPAYEEMLVEARMVGNFVNIEMARGLQELRGAVVEAATAIGDGIIQGIKAGIDAGIPGLRAAAAAAAREAVSAAKAALKMSSPSEVTADEIGVPFMQGIGLGIQRGFGYAAESLVSSLDRLLGMWTEADFSQLDDFSDFLTKSFEELVDKGVLSAADAARIIVGTPEAPGVAQVMDDMLQYIRANAEVNTDMLAEIERMFGEAGAGVFAQLNDRLQSVALETQIQAVGMQINAAQRQVEEAQARSEEAQANLEARSSAIEDARNGIANARTYQEYTAAREQVRVAEEQARLAKEQADAAEEGVERAERQKTVLEEGQETLERQLEVIQDHLAGLETIEDFYASQLGFVEKIFSIEERRRDEAERLADAMKKEDYEAPFVDPALNYYTGLVDQFQNLGGLLSEAVAIDPNVVAAVRDGVSDQLAKSKTDLIVEAAAISATGQKTLSFAVDYHAAPITIEGSNLNVEQMRNVALDVAAEDRRLFLAELRAMIGQ